jgi:WD40 repeat protein
LAAGTEGGLGYVWSPASSRLLEILHGASTQPLNAVAFSNRGMLATGAEDGSVRVWAPTPDLPARQLPGISNSTGPSVGGAVPSEHLAAFGDASKVIVTDDVGNVVNRFNPGGESGGPFAVAANGDAAVVRHNRVDVLRLPAGRSTVRSWSLPSGTSPTDVTISADGAIAATGDSSGTVVLFSNRATRITHVHVDPNYGDPRVSLSSDGQFLAVTSATNVSVFRTNNLMAVVHTESGERASFAPVGNLIAVQRRDLSIVLLNSRDWSVQAILRGQSTLADGIAFSPDSRLVAASSSDGTFRLWDASDGTLLTTRYVLEQNPLAALPGYAYLVSAPVLTSGGYALVNLGFYSSMLEYNVCQQCLDARALLTQANSRLAEIRPTTAP